MQTNRTQRKAKQVEKELQTLCVVGTLFSHNVAQGNCASIVFAFFSDLFRLVLAWWWFFSSLE
jgi:hypothetical protein